MKRTIASLLALAALAIPAASFAALKYQPGDYVQGGLVVHLDGIRNAGAGLPHDPAAVQWANLANPTNPAAIKANASSGWRNDGYYFSFDSSGSYAQFVSATPEMANATFEIAVDAKLSDQNAFDWGSYFVSVGANTGICGFDKNGTLCLNAVGWTGGTGSDYRPRISGWGWKQASFTVGDAGAAAKGLKAYERGICKDERARASIVNVPATRWYVANYSTAQKYQVVGTMKSVRIYNRALSADEVAQNAAIDAARFEGVMPVTNAVVATSVSGAEGSEATGVYAVDGAHVFTAPPSRTVSGTTWALAGCTVETWENGAYGAPETRTGVFAVEVAESEKVRITWNWTQTAATLGGYVTDGLVVWLDGIWNAGIGKPHASSATQWANLADASNPAAITANASSKWMDDGYYFAWNSTASYAQLVSEATPMTKATFEFAVDADASTYASWGRYFIGHGGNARGICFATDGSTKYLMFDAIDWTGNSSNSGRSRFPSDDWSWKQASFTLGAANSTGLKAYDSGTLKGTIARTSADDGSIPSTRWLVGTRGNSKTATTQVIGTMKSVRIYNRELSAAEVAQNAAADDARFVGRAGGVEITADPRGFAGREPAGFYTPDGWTFSAGTTTYTLGGITYAPAGYILETWDPATSSWVFDSRVLRDGENAVEYTPPAAPFANRRLTWLWEAVSGIRRASDYTIDDYAPVGISVWFDGIRNDGIGAAHVSDSSHSWRELVSGQPANMGVNANSGWESDGYRFAVGPNNERSYVYLRQLVSIGTVGTIEISCDAKGADQTVEWPKFLTFGYTNESWNASYDNGMCIQSHQKESSLRLVDDAWTGNNETSWAGTQYANWNYRANTSTWDGRHAAFVVDADSHRSYLKGVRNQTNPCRAVVQAMTPAFWVLGNSYYVGSNPGAQLVGTMKAVRAYSRVLTDDEIAHNYKVDVARFDGALVTTNVLVAASDYNGALAADAYEVFGSHTFVGAEGPDGVPNRVKVWTLNNGAWVLSETIPEASYTYEPGVSPATVKIEFSKTNPFVLVVR